MKLYTPDEQFIKEVKDYPVNFTGIIYQDNYKEYLVNGKWHRDNDLPAIIYYDSNSTWWYYEGMEHRIEGPAVIYDNGQEEWWIYGKECTKEQHTLLVDIMKLKGLI